MVSCLDTDNKCISVKERGQSITGIHDSGVYTAMYSNDSNLKSVHTIIRGHVDTQTNISMPIGHLPAVLHAMFCHSLFSSD